MTARLIGGPQLRARLARLADAPPEFAATWADDTATKMRQTAPNARRAESRRFTTKVGRFRAAVYGAFWWVFVDRGTKAHDIFGSGRRNPPDLLMFPGTRKFSGQTIFASKAHHKRTRRNPFISRAAQQALAGSKWADTVIKQWNGRRIGGRHVKFL